LLIDWNDSHVIDEGDKYAFIYWGTPPDFMDEPVHNGWYVDEQDPNWAETNNTGNLMDCNDHRVDLTQFGGPFYSTIEEAKNLFGDKEVLEIILVLDGSWLADQVLLVDHISVRTYTGIYTNYIYDANPLGPEPAEPGDGDLNLDGKEIASKSCAIMLTLPPMSEMGTSTILISLSWQCTGSKGSSMTSHRLSQM
jgi:hypothetical protein